MQCPADCAEWKCEKARGPTGPRGPRGADGPPGVQGPRGVQGARGIQGNTGPQGIRGDKGDTGPQGYNGSIIRYGINRPSIPVESHGTDMYIQTTDRSLWWFIGHHWVHVESVHGPQGDQGPTGATGPVIAEGSVGVEDIYNSSITISTTQNQVDTVNYLIPFGGKVYITLDTYANYATSSTKQMTVVLSDPDSGTTLLSCSDVTMGTTLAANDSTFYSIPTTLSRIRITRTGTDVPSSGQIRVNVYVL